MITKQPAEYATNQNGATLPVDKVDELLSEMTLCLDEIEKRNKDNKTPLAKFSEPKTTNLEKPNKQAMQKARKSDGTSNAVIFFGNKKQLKKIITMRYSCA